MWLSKTNTSNKSLSFKPKRLSRFYRASCLLRGSCIFWFSVCVSEFGVKWKIEMNGRFIFHSIIHHRSTTGIDVKRVGLSFPAYTILVIFIICYCGILFSWLIWSDAKYYDIQPDITIFGYSKNTEIYFPCNFLNISTYENPIKVFKAMLILKWYQYIIFIFQYI